MSFQPTMESISTHEIPTWFEDAKFGIFVHWGPYSVPAWAPLNDDIQQVVRKGGMSALMRANPYAEWYLNSLRIDNTPTRRYHSESYPEGTSYDSFTEEFTKESAGYDSNAWAELFERAGAKYAVLVTKHHDGFTLWPSRHENPKRGAYGSKEDLVGSFCDSVRSKGIRAGLYYSGVLDWTYQDKPIQDLYTFVTTQNQPVEYVEYATAHWRELIERYEPSVLWNDIGYPYGANVPELIADYYNTVEDGVVNDRWRQNDVPSGFIGKVGMRVMLMAMASKMKKGLSEVDPKCHYDFRTPEYASYDEIRTVKWESTRGIGHSFGLNRQESETHMLKGVELIRMLVDIVSKNGNLLLNVGPAADGTIPDMQKKPLLELGSWLEANGDAIYGTRPWRRAADHIGGRDIRYTSKDGVVFINVCGAIESTRLIFHDMGFDGSISCVHLASGKNISARSEGGTVNIDVPKAITELKEDRVHVFRVASVS